MIFYACTSLIVAQKTTLVRPQQVTGVPAERYFKEIDVETDQYFLFVVITSAFLLSPGPSVMLSISNGVRYGVKSASIGVLGNVAAFQVLILLSAVGLGAILTASSEIFTFLKYIGALYLFYLGVKIWRAPALSHSIESSEYKSVLNNRSIFKHAFLVTSTNPKALLYVSALLPQFINTQQLLFPQILILGVTSAVIQCSIFMSYVVVGHKSRYWFESPVRLKVFNKISGVTFMGFGAALGLSENK